MFDILFNIPNQPVMYQIALLILLILIGECAMRLTQLRWGIAGVVYSTVGLWYFVDLPYRPEGYQLHSSAELDVVFMQVLIFIVAFRVCVEVVVPTTSSQVLHAFDPRELDRGRIVGALMGLWLVLFSIGMYRADFRVIDALFPLGSRWSGAQMWARGRFGGPTDFLVSIGNYSYLMCCAAFGLMAVATRRPALRRVMLFMAALTWPMFALSGSRSQLLIVALPAIFAVLILKNWSRAQQVVFLGLCFGVINTAMLISIASRNEGIGNFFAADSSSTRLDNQKHAGLNMAEELVYINRYQEKGLLEPAWGGEYFAQAVNFVPRAIWADKPFPGKEFAVLRVGYHNGKVAATISNGLVGQGVQNFGKWPGPAVPAMLLTIMVSFMCRLTRRGSPFLRSCLVIFLMALIPNLGRDLTLFTLWPAVFGYVAVVYYEKNLGQSRFHRGRYVSATMAPRSPTSR